MEELNIIQMVLEYVDVIYIVICNIITYLLLNFIQKISKTKINKPLKRTISAIVGVFLGFLVVYAFGHNGETVFYSFFIQFLTWDYFFKWIKNKFKTSK
jgi:uncharacterized protein YacL